MIDTPRQDAVSLIGEVRSADLNGCDFTLRLDDGTEIPCKFTPQQEAIVTQALRDHAGTRVHVRGRAQLARTNGNVRRVVFVEELSTGKADNASYDAAVRPIWELAGEITDSVPDEVWATVPTDLAQNFDHYLYGAPKEVE